MSRQHPRAESSPPWYSHLNIDLFHKVLHRTILHPIISMFLPLCFLAQSYRLHHAPVYWSMVYSFAVNVYFFANLLNRRLAFGTKREFDWTEEVVLITGGASGLGLIIAEVYGMRGVAVAVLDKVVPEGAEEETRGVRFWKCDVGSPEEVERVKREVEEELGTVTVLINNAAVVRGKPLLELSAEEVISFVQPTPAQEMSSLIRVGAITRISSRTTTRSAPFYPGWLSWAKAALSPSPLRLLSSRLRARHCMRRRKRRLRRCTMPLRRS